MKSSSRSFQRDLQTSRAHLRSSKASSDSMEHPASCLH
ncbi:mCG140101, isoform CRA_a [Mus musculus]|nr:mCG140101, isoform CRA_a [Mus musculus]EDL01456.1 mCG140101, isoform CRA_a [Mus musculus]